MANRDIDYNVNINNNTDKGMNEIKKSLKDLDKSLNSVSTSLKKVYQDSANSVEKTVKNSTTKAKKELSDFQKYNESISKSIVNKFIGAEAVIRTFTQAIKFSIDGIKEYAKYIGDTKSIDILNNSINALKLQIGKDFYPVLVQLASFLKDNISPILESLHRTIMFIQGAVQLTVVSFRTLFDLSFGNLINFMSGAGNKKTWENLNQDANSYVGALKKIGGAFGEINKNKDLINPFKIKVKVDKDALKKEMKRIEDEWDNYFESSLKNNQRAINIIGNLGIASLKDALLADESTIDKYFTTITNSTEKQLKDYINVFEGFIDTLMEAVDTSSEIENKIITSKISSFNILIDLAERYKKISKEINAVNVDTMLSDIKMATTGTPKEKAIYGRTKELDTSLSNVDKEITNEKDREKIIKELIIQYNEDIKKIELDFIKEKQSIRDEANANELRINGNFIGSQLAQIEKSFIEELDLIQNQYDQRLISYEDYISRMTIASKDLQQQSFQTVLDGITTYADAFQQINQMMFNSIADITKVATDNKLKEIDRWYNKEKEALNNSVMSNRKRQKEMEKLDAEANKKKETEQRKAFNREKALNIASAIMSGAVAFMNALKTQPIWLGIALAAATAVTTGVQVATIAAQKFAKGGIVGGNSTTGDNITARVNSGEMVLNKQQQSRLFAIANGNGGSGKNININMDTIINGNVDEDTLARFDERNIENRKWFERQLRQARFDGVLA